MTEDEMHLKIAELKCTVLRLTGERDRLAKHVRETDRIFLQACRDRDEARREVCTMHVMLVAHSLKTGQPVDGAPSEQILREAERRGWPSCFDVFDTRGLDGDPKEPRTPRQELKMGSWVDEGSHA